MEPARTSDPAWHFATKILFRFTFVYSLLYIFPSPLDFLPFTDWLGNYSTQLWDKLVLWMGKEVLEITYDFPIAFNGSGDRTYDYIRNLLIMLAAVIGCTGWTLLDRQRRDYRTLFYWLTVIMRYYLAVVMFGYGFAKVFKTQFPDLRLERLLTTYGDSSPMGLVWNFMGYSWSYNVFTGGAEVLGGLLLLFRRTTTLGALVVIGVMSNVAMLNFSYDVPVKLYSVNLLLIALFLLTKDIQRLVDFFILNRPAPAVDLMPPYSDKRIDRARWVVKTLFIGYVLFTSISQVIELQKTRGNPPVPPLYGIYDAQIFIRNGDTLAPVLTDPTRWRKLLIDVNNRVSIKYMNDQLERIGFRPDTLAQTITVFTLADTARKSLLHYTQSTSENFVFRGRWRDDSVHIYLKRFDPNDFLLLNRGYHWINERPFNR